jgi:hypothetical protein
MTGGAIDWRAGGAELVLDEGDGLIDGSTTAG